MAKVTFLFCNSVARLAINESIVVRRQHLVKNVYVAKDLCKLNCCEVSVGAARNHDVFTPSWPLSDTFKRYAGVAEHLTLMCTTVVYISALQIPFTQYISCSDKVGIENRCWHADEGCCVQAANSQDKQTLPSNSQMPSGAHRSACLCVPQHAVL